MPDLDALDAFAREDSSPDAVFHAAPRLVGHLDAAAQAAVRAAFAALLPPGGELLELGANWNRSLAPHFPRRSLVGLGRNQSELASNPQLDRALVHDLNRDPRLPFADAAFDAVFCTNAVAYLSRPIEVFAEVRRVLRTGGPFVVVFGRRFFPTRAVRVWREADDAGRAALVRAYFRRSASAHPQWIWESVTDAVLCVPDGLFGDAAFVVHGRAAKPLLTMSPGEREPRAGEEPARGPAERAGGGVAAGGAPRR